MPILLVMATGSVFEMACGYGAACPMRYGRLIG